jgi:hypothetical protein
MIQPERNMRPMTEMRVRAHVNKALATAIELGLYGQVQQVDALHWRVPSTTRGGTAHMVTGGQAKPPHLDCTCEAGSFLPYCVHRAAVWISLAIANGNEVEIDRQGKVWLVERKPAERFAYDTSSYEALIPDEPPLTAYEADAPAVEPLEPTPLRHPRKSVLDAD